LPKVLIIDDEPDMLLGLRDNCEYEGYEVVVAPDGESGIQRTLESRPDIILLDVMLPKLSGLDVCRHLRKKGIDTPIIMLTARGQEIDKVVGLEVGADDYVTKPFGVQELLARVRAHLRRSAAGRPLQEYSFADVELNFKTYEAKKAGHSLEMSPREFETLKYLITREGEVVTRDQLLENVWGYNAFPLTRTVDNHIAKLRHKLETSPSDPRHILTVHRVGYKFVR
jgi:two-component system alkaline phosphatase synthesis response regulator PhoP